MFSSTVIKLAETLNVHPLDLTENEDRVELAKKLEESQRENKELKAKNEELNEEKLQKRYTKESNDSLNNMLLGVVKQAPIILKGLGFNVPIEANGLGVASELLVKQHLWVANNKIKKIKTKSQNHFHEMIRLNLKHGFEIVGTEAGPNNEIKVLFEKTLNI